MVTKKKLLDTILTVKNNIDKLTKKFQYVSPEEMTPEVINLDAQIKAANARMQIGGEKNEFNLDNWLSGNDSIYSQIQNNQLPREYSWVYYKAIINIALIWLNRYSKFETKVHNKNEIINAQFASILYGCSAYDTKDKKAYFVSFQNEKIIGYPIADIYQQDFFLYSNDDWGINSTYIKNGKELNRDNIVLFQWQMGKIGIFVWYMQDLLNYLVMQDILLMNTNALGCSLMFEIKDKEAFKQQWRYLLNPRQLVKPFILNEASDINRLMNLSPELASHSETIMNTLRFWEELMFNKWGIKITSAKGQSLSSDANLSASISATIAWEHDRRMIESMEKLGIKNFKINEPEVIQPYNQNADKGGTAETNTAAYLNERKSE